MKETNKYYAVMLAALILTLSFIGYRHFSPPDAAPEAPRFTISSGDILSWHEEAAFIHVRLKPEALTSLSTALQRYRGRAIALYIGKQRVAAAAARDPMEKEGDLLLIPDESQRDQALSLLPRQEQAKTNLHAP